MNRIKNTEDWFKLDNASKIYPSTGNTRWNAVYRVCAVMKERVDREALQQALDVVIERFPTYNVVLRKGFFWYFLQGATIRPVVTREKDYPCKKFDIMNREPLFRVMYSGNRIMAEFSHCISDGNASTNFLNTLILKYLHILGKKVDRGTLLHYNDAPKEEEFEDSYSRYYDPKGEKTQFENYGAYHLQGAKELKGVVNVIHGEVATDKLLALSHSAGVSLNEYILGVLAYVLYNKRKYDAVNKNSKRPISVQYSVDLRHYFPSSTLRMFSGFVNTILREASHKDMTFDEILQAMVKESRERCTKENFQKFINSNFSFERNWLIRIAPLFIKNLAMKIAYYNQADRLSSLIITNMGRMNVPAEFADYIDRYELIIGPQKYNNSTMTICSFNNKTVFTFVKTIKSSYLEREFFKFLQEHGVDVFTSGNNGGRKYDR